MSNTTIKTKKKINNHFKNFRSNGSETFSFLASLPLDFLLIWFSVSNVFDIF